MMEIERKYDTAALRQVMVERSPEEREAFRQEICKHGKKKEQRDEQDEHVKQGKVLNEERQKWLEKLVENTIEFYFYLFGMMEKSDLDCNGGSGEWQEIRISAWFS